MVIKVHVTIFLCYIYKSDVDSDTEQKSFEKNI